MLRNSRVSLGRIKNFMRSSNVTLGNIEKIKERRYTLGILKKKPQSVKCHEY